MNTNYQNNINVDVDLESVNIRLDVYLTSLFNNFSRTYIQDLISQNQVLVNDKPSKSSYKLKLGDLLNVQIPEEQPIEIIPENIPLTFVYEDEYLAVINKPAGMLTHPAPGKYSGTLVNALLFHCKDSLSGINGFLRPGIVHRLDKDTSGLMLIAKNDLAHHHLAKQFQDRLVEKYYVAIIQGNIKEDYGTINAPIDRHPTKRERMAVVENAKSAITTWKVLERFKTATFIEAKPYTGRTHQIRVHFAYIKHPILGDSLYGNVKSQKIYLERQALQAYKIAFTHPKTNDILSFEIDFDQDLKKILHIFNSRLLERKIEI